jgi:hypothetical protein
MLDCYLLDREESISGRHRARCAHCAATRDIGRWPMLHLPS